MLNRGSSSATLRKPLPVNDVTFASTIIAITDVLAAGVGVAGTTGTIMLTYGPVASSNGDLVGKFGDSSLVVTSTALTTEVPFETVMARAGANQNNVDAGTVDYTAYLTNGEYYVVYETGRIYYAKYDASTAASCAYKIRGGTAKIASGSITATIGVPTVLTGGTKAVTTSGTGLALGATLATKSIYIRAKLANTGNVYVGDSAVDASTSQQIVLAAGDSVTIDIADRATVYVDAAVNGEGVDYLCMS